MYAIRTSVHYACLNISTNLCWLGDQEGVVPPLDTQASTIPLTVAGKPVRNSGINKIRARTKMCWNLSLNTSCVIYI